MEISREELAEMGLLQKLSVLQTEIKVPKNNRNDFGGFNFRSNEDILQALKEPLEELGCILTQSDEMVMLGDRFYVKATATLSDCESGEAFETSAYAREALSKAKFDEAQLTGSASSYARKYSLAGLLGLSSGDDPDSHDNSHASSHQNQEGNQGHREEDKSWLNDTFGAIEYGIKHNLSGEDAVKVARNKYRVNRARAQEIVQAVNNHHANQQNQSAYHQGKNLNY